MMLSKEEEKNFNFERDMVEYGASFMNGKAVADVRDKRQQGEKHKFKTDEEFEKEVTSNAFKENKLLQDIIKARKEHDANLNKYNSRNKSGKVDLDYISKLKG